PQARPPKERHGRHEAEEALEAAEEATARRHAPATGKGPAGQTGQEREVQEGGETREVRREGGGRIGRLTIRSSRARPGTEMRAGHISTAAVQSRRAHERSGASPPGVLRSTRLVL